MGYSAGGYLSYGVFCGKQSRRAAWIRATRRETIGRYVVSERIIEAEQALTEDQPRRSDSKMSHGLWAAGGFLFFALGMVGVVLPILPTTPFVLVAAFCFARSSARLNAWFKGTKVYKRVLEGYVTKRSMTLKAKLSILVPVTILLAIGFALMGRVPVGRIVLAVVWVAHIVYFGFVVKTDRG